MKKIVGILLCLILFGFGNLPAIAQQSSVVPFPKYQRIISLAPSGTEILFALGLGDQVVGVTRYCRFPPEAQQKTIIGTFLDTNFELVYRLNPDLVVLLNTEMGPKLKLEQMGFNVLMLETNKVSDVIEAITRIGSYCDRKAQATEITDRIKERIQDIQSKTKSSSRPRVLVTFARTLGEGNINNVYVAGTKSFFHDIITIAGGQNAYNGLEAIASPVVSAEGVLQMNPDVIIEVLSDLKETNLNPAEVIKDWDTLPELKAYQNKQIYIFTDDYLGISGPRITQTLDRIARSIHPEIKWDP